MTSEQKELSGISVNMRIPPIWRDRLRLWFAQFESIVSAQKKGDQAMYDLVVGQLERQDIDEICDIMLNPPANDKYPAIKKRLLEVYEDSEQRRLQRLFSEMELGDNKPSQLLRRMQSLAGNSIPESTLRIMWTNHLPQSARAALTISETIAKKTDVNELALVADRIIEQTNATSAAHSTSISAVDHQQPSTSAHTERTETHEEMSMQEKIDMLVYEIAELKAQRRDDQRRTPFRRDWRAV